MNNAASATNAVTSRYIPDPPKPFRYIDVIIIIVCLFIAFCFFRLFYLNLFQTLDSHLEPMGFVTMKINNIQRRQGDRMLWDRINNESPIYPGDLIRVAEQSGVNLHFDNNSVELDENTMIRVLKSVDGQTRIELATGTLNLDTGEDGGNISLLVGGKTVEATAGTKLSLVSSDDDIILNVEEGHAVFIDEAGDAQEALSGMEIAFVSEQLAPNNRDLLPAPNLIQPANGYTLGTEHLRAIRGLNFRWEPVDSPGNTVAYILTLYHDTENGRRRLIQTNPLTETNWDALDLSILARGRFLWQVEAVNISENGAIQRHGQLAQNYFIVDIPVPRVQLNRNVGELYGN